MMSVLRFYFIIINIFAFIQFGVDKFRAIHGMWRISERRLMCTALAGGAAGSLLGMNFFRHKTRHTKFRLGLPFILLLHLGLFYLAVR